MQIYIADFSYKLSGSLRHIATIASQRQYFTSVNTKRTIYLLVLPTIPVTRRK